MSFLVFAERHDTTVKSESKVASIYQRPNAKSLKTETHPLISRSIASVNIGQQHGLQTELTGIAGLTSYCESENLAADLRPSAASA